MAESIGSKKEEPDKDNTEEKPSAPADGSGEKPADGEKKGGKIDLAALAAKANAIGKN